MKTPQKPENELDRLTTLYKTKLLDSPPEERFDRLTRLAQQLFNVPMALITLVDADRQWFKSKQGLDAVETHRDISFCGHAILQPEIFEVPDASKDNRFADNPFVSGEPFIRFYAGIPLFIGEGHPIGTLCILDSRPRQLSESDRSALNDLADLVSSEIDHAERYTEYDQFKSLQKLSEVIVRAQSNFINQEGSSDAFSTLLDDLLQLTGAQQGFITDVAYTSDGEPFLKPLAITDSAEPQSGSEFYSVTAPDELNFRNLDELLNQMDGKQEPVIFADTNESANNDSSQEVLLGIPIHGKGKIIAMVGIAHKKGGFDDPLIRFLKPLLMVIEQVFQAKERRREQEALKKELRYLSNVASQTTNAVIITDLEGKTEWVNEGFTRLTGYTPDEIEGRKPGDLLQGPETSPDIVEEMRQARLNTERFEVDVINYTKNGDPYWVRIYCNPLVNDDGVAQGFISIQSNIDAQKRDEIALKEAAQLQSTILNTMVDGLVTTDQNGTIQMCNPAIEGMFGYSEKWLTGRNIKLLMPESYARVHDGFMQKYQVSTSDHDIMGKARALTAKRYDGSIFPVEITVKETQHKGNRLYVASIRDISALKEQQEKIEKLAYFDPLTNLANRRLLKARIQSLSSSDSQQQVCHALLFIDLDNFKNINDSLGHSLGDKLLVEVGQRISSSVLSCSDTVARLGGDEFCVLLSNLGEHNEKAKDSAKHVAERIINEIEKPLLIDNERLKTSASIGVSLFCNEKIELTALMKQADIAMYEAKEQGKNQVCFFNTDLEQRLLKRLSLESELRVAIDTGALSVHYQPVVDSSSRIVKVEALVRWHHPNRGWISPDTFIPIAEAFHLIVPLGEFVLKTAINDMERWIEKAPELNWRLAINISQFQLSSDHFKQQIERALSGTCLDPSRLILEVTETALAKDIDQNIKKMTDLRSLGLAFSLDDFGTGYSSLAYLKQLPISELKIDRSFVQNTPHDLDDVAIVNSVLSLARVMSLEVVAEGVETEEHWKFLKGLDCDLFQGYYFSKPIPADEVEKLIEDDRM